jgi:D-beta-D-heptose 7-phosphate kinase/D-beta-D-heptose 1-phosphate adenosyltransferase
VPVVVLTNGVFDCLHLGHLVLLHRAKSLGTRLVVCVNSDASVRRAKGPGRPIVPDEERLFLIASLKPVDDVEVFDTEDDLLRLIARHRPDVLVKGSDYAGREITGRELVESWGGRVVLVGRVAGRSTTGLVERMRAGVGCDKSDLSDLSPGSGADARPHVA